ncbi:MAG: hypothetical protein MZW92_36100 [Comamonadaceae bacterium]|nr:hypothetical protein [Comamonadaceae bacterium]
MIEGIAQHHERMNGSGYPGGLKGEQIGIYGRMAGISDCFAALTKSRPYAQAVSSMTRCAASPAGAAIISTRLSPSSSCRRSACSPWARSSNSRRRGRRRGVAQQGSQAQAPRPPAHGARQVAVGLSDHGGPAVRPAAWRQRTRLHPAQPADRRLRPESPRELPLVTLPRTPLGPGFPAQHPSESARDDLLRFLDREAAIAQATKGRLAVLLVELRRVDRLQALLKGPPAAVTLSLVLERLRPALRPEDRIAALNEEQVSRAPAHLASDAGGAGRGEVPAWRSTAPSRTRAARPVLRPCVGIATVPEHAADPARLLMAADVARRIAGNREEGYHLFQSEDSVEAEVYHGLDIDLQRAIRANELEVHYQPQVEVASGRIAAAEALAALAPSHVGTGRAGEHHRHRRKHRAHLVAHALGPERRAAQLRAAQLAKDGIVLRFSVNSRRAPFSTTTCRRSSIRRWEPGAWLPGSSPWRSRKVR